MARAYLKSEEALEDLISALRKFDEQKSELVSKVSRENTVVREWLDDCIRNRERELRSISEQLDAAVEALSRARRDDPRVQRESGNLLEDVKRLRQGQEVAIENLRVAKRTQQELTDKIALFQRRAQGFQQSSSDALSSGLTFVQTRLSAALKYMEMGGSGGGNASPRASANVVPSTKLNDVLSAIPYAYSSEAALLNDVHNYLWHNSREICPWDMWRQLPQHTGQDFPTSALAAPIRKDANDRGADDSFLTDEEVIAIRAYTEPKSIFITVNRALCDVARGVDTSTVDKSVLAFAFLLQRALSKLPDHEGTFIRNTTLEDLNNIEGSWMDELIRSPKFLSTSRDGKLFASRPVRIAISSRRGKDVTAFANDPGEREVILLAGQSFSIEVAPERDVHGFVDAKIVHIDN